MHQGGRASGPSSWPPAVCLRAPTRRERRRRPARGGLAPTTAPPAASAPRSAHRPPRPPGGAADLGVGADLWPRGHAGEPEQRARQRGPGRLVTWSSQARAAPRRWATPTPARRGPQRLPRRRRGQARSVKRCGRRPRGTSQRAAGHSPGRTGSAPPRWAHASGGRRLPRSQRQRLTGTPCAWAERPESREMPGAVLCCLRRRALGSSRPQTLPSHGPQTATNHLRRRRLACRGEERCGPGAVHGRSRGACPGPGPPRCSARGRRAKWLLPRLGQRSPCRSGTGETEPA